MAERPKGKRRICYDAHEEKYSVGRDGWELTQCPACGCECWKTPLLSVVLQQGATALCMGCALRKGVEANG